MLYLTGGGSEALVSLPTTLDVSPTHFELSTLILALPQKAIQLAVDKFNIPKDAYIVRLSCRASEMPIIGGFAAEHDVFL